METRSVRQDALSIVTMTVAVHSRELVNQANQDKVKTIFIQPEFPASGAKRVAEAIGGRTVCISVLEYDVPANMIKTASLLAESFEE